MDKARHVNSEGYNPDSERYNNAFLHVDISCEYLDMCVLIIKFLEFRKLVRGHGGYFKCYGIEPR